MVQIELMNIFYSNSNQRFPRSQVAITTLMAKGEMRTWDQRKGSKQAEHFPGSQLEKRKRKLLYALLELESLSNKIAAKKYYVA